MKKILRSFLLWLARSFGPKLIDQRTGKPVGRVFIFVWRGRIQIFGLPEDGLIPEVKPAFRPQRRLTFSVQEVEFSSYPEPDFPHLPPEELKNGAAIETKNVPE